MRRTLAGEGGEVDGALFWVVFLQGAARGELVAFGERLATAGLAFDLVDESTGWKSAQHEYPLLEVDIRHVCGILSVNKAFQWVSMLQNQLVQLSRR